MTATVTPVRIKNSIICREAELTGWDWWHWTNCVSFFILDEWVPCTMSEGKLGKKKNSIHCGSLKKSKIQQNRDVWAMKLSAPNTYSCRCHIPCSTRLSRLICFLCTDTYHFNEHIRWIRFLVRGIYNSWKMYNQCQVLKEIIFLLGKANISIGKYRLFYYYYYACLPTI